MEVNRTEPFSPSVRLPGYKSLNILFPGSPRQRTRKGIEAQRLTDTTGTGQGTTTTAATAATTKATTTTAATYNRR
jgi:hypothetical protein